MKLDRNGLEVLDSDECWQLLSENHLGRLAVVAGNRPEIFPLNYVVDDSLLDATRTEDSGPDSGEDSRSLVFRTAPGTKLAAAAVGFPVAFEVDSADPMFHTGWSVVVHGTAQLVETTDELLQVEALPLRPWGPSDKRHYLRLCPTELDGRRIPRGTGH